VSFRREKHPTVCLAWLFFLLLCREFFANFVQSPRKRGDEYQWQVLRTPRVRLGGFLQPPRASLQAFSSLGFGFASLFFSTSSSKFSFLHLQVGGGHSEWTLFIWLGVSFFSPRKSIVDERIFPDRSGFGGKVFLKLWYSLSRCPSRPPFRSGGGRIP